MIIQPATLHALAALNRGVTVNIGGRAVTYRAHLPTNDTRRRFEIGA